MTTVKNMSKKIKRNERKIKRERGDDETVKIEQKRE